MWGPLERFAAWLAAAAMLAASLAPTVSHALAAGGGAVGAICTPSGMVPAQSPAEQPAGPAQQAHLVHCPFCLTHAGSFGLLPQPALAVAVLAGPDLPPGSLRSQPQQQRARATAQPRAPPAAS